MNRPISCWAGVIALTLFVGCGAIVREAAAQSVVVYSALDREFAEPVLKAYGQRNGVRVLPKFDVESTKTVGLTNLIVVEAARPRCDLFWNNEILNTLRSHSRISSLYHPNHACDLPESFKAKDGTWHSLCRIARILIVNTKLVAEADRPKGIKDLLDPKWKGKVGIAKPLFGTTATHAACLFAVWGDARGQRFFRDLKANGVHVLSGNKQVALAAGSGEIAIGLTDTDDAMGEIDAGSPVSIIYPDREADGLGTLFVPNVLAIIKGSPHPKEAEALADYLLSPDVEGALARGPSAQIPLLKSTKVEARVETPKTVHAMDVDFEAAAKLWDKVATFLASEFATD